MHCELIKRYGYAPLEVVRELVERSEDLQKNLCVAAHLAHVSFASRLSRGGEILPRYSISLCSGIDEQTCRQVKLGYLNPATFDREAYSSDPDTLVVEHAGRELYLVEPIKE